MRAKMRQHLLLASYITLGHALPRFEDFLAERDDTCAALREENAQLRRQLEEALQQPAPPSSARIAVAQPSTEVSHIEQPRRELDLRPTPACSPPQPVTDSPPRR